MKLCKSMCLFVIEAPHFVCGLTSRDSVVLRSAPIISYMYEWHMLKVYDYCESKSWQLGFATYHYEKGEVK